MATETHVYILLSLCIQLTGHPDGHKGYQYFCPTFPQVLCFRVGGRSWGPSRECPGPMPLVVLSHLFGGGPGLWYLEVCNSQVLCPWSGAVPGSYFGGKKNRAYRRESTPNGPVSTQPGMGHSCLVLWPACCFVPSPPKHCISSAQGRCTTCL